MSKPFWLWRLFQGGRPQSKKPRKLRVEPLETRALRAGVFSIAALDPSVEEGGMPGYRVTLSEAPTEDCWILVQSINGTATDGQDYYGTSVGMSLSFAVGGSLSRDFALTTIDDSKDEWDETFTVRLALAPPGTSISATNGSVTQTIVDNDPEPSIGIRNEMVTCLEGGQAVFHIDLSAVSGKDVKVWYLTLDGDAKSASDYQSATSVSLEIRAGASTGFVAIPTIDDAIDEPNYEDFALKIVDPRRATLGRNEAGALIADNDALPTINLSPRTIDEDQSMTLVVSLDAISGRNVTFTLQTGDFPETFGFRPAKAGLDYAAVNAQYTIDAGLQSKTITIPINDDALWEYTLEQFGASISNIQNASPGTYSVVCEIIDNDLPPLVDTVVGTSATEGTAVQFEVTLTAAAGRPVPLAFETSAGSASETAPEQDYTGIHSSTFYIPAGSTGNIFYVSTIDDTAVEGDEAFTLAVTGPRPNTVQGTGTIRDNDAPGSSNLMSPVSQYKTDVHLQWYASLFEENWTWGSTSKTKTRRGEDTEDIFTLSLGLNDDPLS